MARFYGTIQGARGPTSRLGHSSLHVSAQSYQGDVNVSFHRMDTDKVEVDMVTIAVRPHDGGPGVYLYSGPVTELLAKGGRQDKLVRDMAKRMLSKQANRDELVREMAERMLAEQYGGKE